jgi:hypothetical protein
MIIKKKFKLLFIIITLLIIFFKFNDFFRNAYFIIKYDYIKRLEKSYDVCGGQSIPFLNYIKNEYKISGKPQIVNYDPMPTSKWFFLNNKYQKKNDNFLILLNYKSQLNYNFNLNKNFLENSNYLNDGLYKELKSVKVYFNSKVKDHLKNNRRIKIKFYQSDIGSEKYFTGEIFLKFKNIEKNYYEYFLEENSKIKISSRMRRVYLDVFSQNRNITKDIKLLNIDLEHLYDLENLKIIYKDQNCFLIKL